MAIQESDSFAGGLGIDSQPVKSYLSTGCTILDLAIADRLPGGFAAGRISHIYGPESSAKSVILQEPLGAAQRAGGFAQLIDQEGTFDFGRAGLFGVDVRSLFYENQPIPEVAKIYDAITIEYLFDYAFQKAIERASDLGKPCALGIDSLSSIPAMKEVESSLGDASYGTSRPIKLSAGFRKLIGSLHGDLALLFVDQTRMNIGMGTKYTVSGGEALKFYASTRVLLEKKKDIENKNKKIIGVEVHFKVTKNKIAPPFRSGDFSLIFDYGIDNIRTNIQWLKDNTGGDSTKKSAWFTIPGADKKFNSMEEAIEFIEENQLESVLEQEVYNVWKTVYSTVPRKVKER